jgi:ABC-type nitrate/sulfonate/bicarbonate transport system substrate-binding protein
MGCMAPGYFEREGLDVEVVLMRGTAPAVQAMIAGSISAGLMPMTARSRQLNSS